MTKTRTPDAAPHRPAAAPALPDGAGWMQDLLKLQAAQWQAMLIWQDAMRAVGQDWWEGWMCRWTGGVPIDG
ncbi:hypothetical protein PFX98_21940 [Paucibacter sediminis]|uniref:Uncharacterized protein n=1 Tax=Paucibacter sediminis TaxID=3019553 RepID=A0AA95NA87_9BURK|nr:hypothetical protein [Paucibacter sp. S2-9]WIT11520.1 hypothetical protein PFX98_21940 [Paucibacter sp. S2-9]